jgi:Tfp pilus assembly protein PilV
MLYQPMQTSVNVNNELEGFSLIETLVSVLLLAIVMLALLEAVTFYTQHNMNNMLRDEAVRITQDTLYNLRTQQYDVVLNAGTITGNTCTTSAPPGAITKNLRVGTFSFNVCWTVVEDNLKAHKTVTAITSWTLQKQTFSHQASIIVSNF